MSLWRQITRGIHTLANRSSSDQDVSEEVQHFLDQATAEFVARGFSPEEARRAARIQMGNMTKVKEEVRSYGWENIVETFFADVRYGLRQLRRNPGFTAITILTLALGIGSTTAIFSAVNPILFQSLPYPRPARIAAISELNSEGGRSRVAFHTYREIVERSRSFSDLAVMKPWRPTLIGTAEPQQFDGQYVSAAYFRVLGVAPAIGRDFIAADDQFHGPKVVIVSDQFWKRRFNGDRAIVGRQITLDDDSFTVIGVMPPTFENVLAAAAEIWRPLQYNPGNSATFFTREWGAHLQLVGRLQPNVTVSQANSDLDIIFKTPVPAFPRARWANDLRFSVSSLQDDVTRAVKPALLAILGAVFLVLLIASANVTNLLLARGVHRRGEFALRTALGAERGRLIRQLLTESLLIAALGAAAGMAAAVFGVRALASLSSTDLPRAASIGVNGTVFAFGLALTTLIGLAFGLIPALHAARSDPQKDLGQGSRRTAGGHRRIRSALVIAECSLSIVLLVSAGLLLRSVQHLFSIAPGFDSSRLLTMQVQTPSHRYYDDAARNRFYAQALEAVRNVPGVSQAAFTSQLPLSGDADTYGATIERESNRTSVHVAFRYGVSPGYFEAMGIPLIRGRLLDARDVNPSAVRPVLINESFAKSEFPTQNPIGQRIRVGGAPDRPWDVIVGVVGDVKQTSLAITQSDAVYVSSAQWLWSDGAMWFVVRARGDVASLTPAITKAVWSVDKDQPIVHIGMMADLLAKSAAERRFALILFEAFALAALVLAAAGIYGVLSGSVAERTREIGVRAALGATRANILALVLRYGMTLTGIGIVIGLAGAGAASQAIASMLFGITRFDLVTYFSVVALLTAVSILACAVPAWRAARVDPAITLRAE
jgi:putative ABC transport system permease protein